MEKELLQCEDCGKISEDVEVTNCPYADDVYNEIIKITICNDCHYERSQDI